MSLKQNLHTHSSFCDGCQTPRELLEIAIGMGFDSIGFSGHSPMCYAPEHGMPAKDVDAYFSEISRLKKEYKGKINVFCGIEYDMYSDIDISRFDYAIGSLHYFNIDGTYVGFDRKADEVFRVINTYFGGNGILFAKKYYEELARLPEYGKFDIIGHFDIITKCCEQMPLIDTESKEYLSYALEAARALQGKIPFFEVNTGAIARGYRKTPYPSVPILKELKRLGFGAVITSDCHDARFLDCAFDEAQELLRECGFNEKYILTDGGFVPVAI